MSVYPNPVQPYGEVTVDMSGCPLSDVEGAKFELIDMLGQRLGETALNSPIQQVQINVNKGVYMYRITLKSNEVIVGKIWVH
jgi:hypothetical protein